MQQSHLNKIAEAYNKIAEGKEPCPVHEKTDAKVDKKKMHRCTCESFYYKRLQAMNPEMAEMYLEIAEELMNRGYESARLLDNIIESLPKDFTGHEFRSCLAAVNPRLNESIHTAEKKQARVIAASFVESLKQARKNVGASTCWDGYKAKGTKKKNGRDVPNCVKEEETVVEADMTGAPSIKDAKPAKKTNVKYDKHMKVMAPTVKEATYPSDFKNPDGSTRAVAKKKTGRPNAQGDYGKKDINEQDAADAKRMKTFQQLQKNVDQKKKLNIRGNDSAEQKARLEKKRGMKLDDHPQFKKEEVEAVDEALKQARKNVGADTCWDGYKAKGTKKKNGREVPNCVKEEEITEKKKGLWDNIHAKRKRGEKPAKPGDKDYPKTLDIEEAKKKDNSYLETDFKKRQANNEKARKDMEKMGTSMKNPHFEDVNYYDVILAYLDENNLMESVEEAEEIMMQLTGAQIVEIIDEFMNSKEESK